MEALSLNEFAKQVLGYQPGTRIPANQVKSIEAQWRTYNAEAFHARASSERPAMEPQVRDVLSPDGGKVRVIQLSNGSWQRLPDYKAPEMKMFQAEDGSMKFADPVTAEVIPAWDRQTGKGVKGAKKVDPFAALLGGAPQPAPVAQSGAATLEPPVPVAAPSPQPAPAPASSSAPAEAPVYTITGEEDYAKVPAGAVVKWNGQTFTKR